MTKFESTKNIPPGSKGGRLYWPWVALLVVILFTSSVRWRLLEAPLERDEGEYAYAGQLLLEGVAPYAQVYSMKMPGIYVVYAVILAVFGQTHGGVHLGLLVTNAVTIILLFLLARRLFNPLTGVAAAAALGLLSLGQFVQGIYANAEHFVLPFALGGILLLRRAIDTEKYWPLLTGAILLGMAFLMKQHGAAFVIFAGAYLIYSQSRRRGFNWKPLALRIVIFVLGAVLPFAVTCGLLQGAGTFDKFWFWTFSYAREYTASQPLSAGLTLFINRMRPIVNSALLLWITAGVGLTSLLWNRTNRRGWVFVVGFLCFSLVAICPGFYFRPHYFILLMPAAALLAGIGAGGVRELFCEYRFFFMKRLVPMLLALVVLGQAVYQQRNFFFKMTPHEATRIIYGINPFVESLEIARFLQQRSLADDKIAILGSEPQICFYAQRRSATAYVYTYEIVKKHKYAPDLQQEMIQQIEAAQPKFLIFVNVVYSWLADPGPYIRDWFMQNRKENYQLVGLIDIFGYPRNSLYLWDQDARDSAPRSNDRVEIYQRVDKL